MQVISAVQAHSVAQRVAATTDREDATVALWEAQIELSNVAQGFDESYVGAWAQIAHQRLTVSQFVEFYNDVADRGVLVIHDKTARLNVEAHLERAWQALTQ